MKLARTLSQTSPLADSLTGETAPGLHVQTDEQWLEWLRQVATSEFHPSSSCAMLPREQGGVVDANLRVYGLSNVRVADASVPPIALSTHLMASTYGLAEQAANIIRGYWNAPTPPPQSQFDTSPNSTTHSTASSQGSGSGGGGGTPTNLKHNTSPSPTGNGAALSAVGTSLLIVAVQMGLVWNLLF